MPRIEELEAKSARLLEEMEKYASDYARLAELAAEKEAVDAEAEQKMERYFELESKRERTTSS